MKLIGSKAELLQQGEGLQGIYQMIELAGRTCYKSEDKITDNSSVDFVKRMITSGHTAMLEHGTVYLFADDFDNSSANSDWLMFHSNPYSKVNFTDKGTYITTNLRVIKECGAWSCLDYLCEPTKFHERRISLKFTTDRGVSHELIRHRVFSFAQESTRYCNYSKDKFGNEITYIIPSWSDIPEGTYKTLAQVTPIVKGVKNRLFFNQLTAVQDAYITLIEEGCTPQEARQVLPNALKTEIVMTGFVSDWKHFFDLRYFGTTGNPHPDMLQLTTKAKAVLEEAGLWHLIYKEN